MARRATPRVLSSTGRAVRGTVLMLAAGVALAGCGASGDEPSAGASSRSSSSASGSPAPPSPSQSTDLEVPAGVTLTSPGAQLAFGETARVAYEVQQQAAGKRRSKKAPAGTVLALTVESATKGSLADLAGFNLTDAYERKASYYYVRVTVKNVGARRFGDVGVPLWGISGENTLLPPVQFTSAFARCPTERLPAGFAPGARFRTCLVFLSPDKGSLEGVSYRPTENFVPIEWHGKVATPKPDRKPRRGRSGRGG
jgi:hypothetical protein